MVVAVGGKKTSDEKPNVMSETSTKSTPLSEPSCATNEALNRLMLQVIACLKDRRMHLLHRIPQFHAEPRENVALPGIVLGVHARLHLLVIDYADPELLLCFRRVEGRARALDLRQELLPIGERVAEAVEDVFCLEVPERLELQPFRNVVFQLLDLGLNQHEWSLQRVIGELRELEKRVSFRESGSG